MTLNVMPKQPFKAIQYTGTNYDELEKFVEGYGIEHRGSDVFLLSDGSDGYYGDVIEGGMWIVEVPRRRYTVGGEPYESPVYTVLRDSEFKERFAPLPLVIRCKDLTDEQKQKLRAYADAETCRCQAMGEY